MRDLPEIDLPKIISEIPLKEDQPVVVEFIEREELIIKDEQPDFNEEFEENIIEINTENKFETTEENKSSEEVQSAEIDDENEKDDKTEKDIEKEIQEEEHQNEQEIVLDVKNEDLDDAEIVNEVLYSDEDVVFSQDIICSSREKEDNQPNEEDIIILHPEDEADPKNETDGESTTVLDDHSYNKDHLEANFETIKNMKDTKKVSQYLTSFIKLLNDKLCEQNEEVELAMEDLEKIEDAVNCTVEPTGNINFI